MAENIMDYWGNLGGMFSTPTPQQTSSNSFMDMLGNLGTGVGNFLGNVNWGSAIPAVGGALGTYQNYQETKDLGKELAKNLQFTPYNVATTTGTATFNPATKQATSALSPALQSMFDTILGKAQAGAQGINLSPEANTQGALGLLRQLGAPEEQRRASELENRLLAQGRLGSTGGAQEQQAFQQALSQADLARQLQAIGLGQETINNLIRNTTGLLGAAQGLGSAPQSLLGIGAGLGGQEMAGKQAAADIQYRTSQAAQDLRNLFLSGLLGQGGAGLSGLLGGGAGQQPGAAGGGGLLGQLGSSLANRGISTGVNYLTNLLGGGAGTAGAGAALAPGLFSGLGGVTGLSETSASLAPGLFSGLPEATGLTGTGLPFGSFGTGSSLAAGGAGAGTAAGGTFETLPAIGGYSAPTSASMLPLPWEGAAGAESTIGGLTGLPAIGAGLGFLGLAGPVLGNLVMGDFGQPSAENLEFWSRSAPVLENYFSPSNIGTTRQKLLEAAKDKTPLWKAFPEIYSEIQKIAEPLGVSTYGINTLLQTTLQNRLPEEFQLYNPFNAPTPTGMMSG